MQFEETSLKGSYLIRINPIVDTRGTFARFFCERELKQILGPRKIVNVNFSRTTQKGAIRGLHFQKPPKAEMKLIRCIHGAVYDVIVDIRKNSPTFLHWFGVLLNSNNMLMLCVPEGFAHGFQVLKDDSEMLYLHTEHYDPDYEDGISVLEPYIGINWPLPISQISERDKNHPYITEKFEGVIL